MSGLDTFWFIVFMVIIFCGMIIIAQVTRFIKRKDNETDK